MLSTSGWDSHVRFWDLTTQDVVTDVTLQSAILSTHYEANFFAAGGYNGYVYQIDPRTSAITTKHRYHSKSVLSLAVDDHFIISASDDKSLCAFDRRADRLATRLKLEQCPLCISSYRNQLWVGDKAGHLILVDASDADFSVVEVYDVGHERQVTGVVCTAGALFTCSMDRTIKVLHPTLSPSLIANLTDHSGDIAKISYQNGVLASACSSSSVGIYRPKSHINSVE
jgi:WD40 repeat protein